MTLSFQVRKARAEALQRIAEKSAERWIKVAEQLRLHREKLKPVEDNSAKEEQPAESHVEPPAEQAQEPPRLAQEPPRPFLPRHRDLTTDIHFETASLLTTPGTLKKLGADLGHSMAVSSGSIRVGPGQPSRGLRFRPFQNDREFHLGFGWGKGAPPRLTNWCGMDFSVCCRSTGEMLVFERQGALKWVSPKEYQANSLIELRVVEEDKVASHFQVEVWLDAERLSSTGFFHGLSNGSLYVIADIFHPGCYIHNIEFVDFK